MNCGQICINADYVLIDESIYEELKEKIVYYTKKWYTQNAEESPIYGRIITENQASNVWKLTEDIPKDKITHIFGEPNIKERFLPPTIIEEPDLDSRIMKEEIFGPLLPLHKYKTIGDTLSIINSIDHPLAV